MKILYFSTARVPDDWAHTQQIVKTCEALAKAGAEVELVIPRRHSTVAGNPHELMGVAPIFGIRRLWSLDLMKTGMPLAFHIMTFTFLVSFARYLHKARPDALYVRGEMVVPLSILFGRRYPVFWETHERPGHLGRYQKVLPYIRGIVTITEYYRQELIREWSLNPAHVMSVPDAVDLAVFTDEISKEEARARLQLPKNRTLAVYTGTDLSWKGVGTLRDAALLLPQEYLVAFVGDIRPDAPDSRKMFPGFQKRALMPLWLAAADVLVLTGTAQSESSSRYTSPMKLFEYLAAGKPIVASDLPSFREILDEKVAYFARPDDASALAIAIRSAAEDPERDAVAWRARELSKRYSWDARAKRILELITARV